MQYDTVPYSQSFKRKENVFTEIHKMFSTMFVMQYQGILKL